MGEIIELYQDTNAILIKPYISQILHCNGWAFLVGKPYSSGERLTVYDRSAVICTTQMK